MINKIFHPNFFVIFISLLIASCASSPPAPVTERVTAKTPAVTTPNITKPTTPIKDWRPDTYTVKKGDTLYSIGLEYGYDYKEIAQSNNITTPYIIRIGQVLKFPEKSASNAAKTIAKTTDANVVVTPLKTESAPTNIATESTPSSPQLLKEPKALREPYSEDALANSKKTIAPPVLAPIPNPVTKTTEVATAAATPKQAPVKLDSAKTDSANSTLPKTDIAKTDVAKSETPKAEDPAPIKKTDTAQSDDDSVDWGWPTSGKVVTTFNEASNSKGIDIAGAQGQAINAAANGKVIYSGSDLRGYGKLVIVKHNKTYLSVYAHNSQILVKEGQSVNKGQKIAEMGNTDSDKVALHFEIRQLGKSVDPSRYLSGTP